MVALSFDLLKMLLEVFKLDKSKLGAGETVERPRLIYFMVRSLPILTLGACGLSDGPGAIWVDPGKFAFYHCEDLARRWKELVEREKELRGLIEKANERLPTAAIMKRHYPRRNCCSVFRQISNVPSRKSIRATIQFGEQRAENQPGFKNRSIE